SAGKKKRGTIPRPKIESKGSRTLVLSTSSPTLSVALVVVVPLMVPVVFSLFSHEVCTPEIRSLGLVDSVFPIRICMKLLHLIFSESGRQRFDRNVGPGAAVSWSPEPMVTVQIVVASTDEVDVIGDTNRDVHL